LQVRERLAVVERRGTCLLGQLVAVRVEHQRDVQVAGCRQPEQALQQDLPGRRADEVGTAHDVGDSLRPVVDDDRQLISPQAIGAAQHEIAGRHAQVFMMDGAVAVDPVDDGRRLPGRRDPQSPGARDAPRRQAVAASARIHRLVMPLGRDAAREQRLADLLARARAGIDAAVGPQAIERTSIGVVPPALPDDRPVGVQAMVRERGEDRRRGARHLAGRVEVFDPQQPSSAMGSGVEKTGQRGDQRAAVQRAGRRWREAADVRVAGKARDGGRGGAGGHRRDRW